MQFNNNSKDKESKEEEDGKNKCKTVTNTINNQMLNFKATLQMLKMEVLHTTILSEQVPEELHILKDN